MKVCVYLHICVGISIHVLECHYGYNGIQNQINTVEGIAFEAGNGTNRTMYPHHSTLKHALKIPHSVFNLMS